MSTTLRIVIALLAVLSAGFYVLVDQLGKRVERQYLEAAEEPMVDAAHLVAALVEGTLLPDGKVNVELLKNAWSGLSQRKVSAKIYEVTKTTVDMNVYVIDAQGQCVFDSRGLEEGVDMNIRRDVALTLSGQYGARSTREDQEDDGSSIMYVGAPVRKDGQILAAVSIIKPQRSMFGFMAQTRKVIETAGWSILFSVGAGIVVLSWWLLRPLRKLKDYALRVSRGERTPLPPLAGSEAVALGQSFEAMRDALENRKYVETYIQGLTHEIKSPLAAIKSAAELAQEPAARDADRERFLSNIESECGRMQRVIDLMLELSEIESRKNLESQEVVNLGQLVESACLEVEQAFAQKGVTLERDMGLNVLVRGDATLLTLSVDNLLQNALEFSPQGGRVRVCVCREDEQAKVIVSDSGQGIPEYALDRVFERFYSLKRPTTGRKSSGLGLCIVKEAAELHGGRARVENRDEGGVCASVLIPAA